MKKTLLILLFSAVIINCLAQKTTFKILNYSPRDYGKGHEAKNLACLQDHNGVLYFGNAGGLLKYDGVSWSFIPVKNQSMWIQALAVSKENVIYLGAQGEFGYLAPDNSGKLIYNSLSDQIPGNQKSFSNIIRLWEWNNNVVFQSEEAIFLLSEGKLHTILPETSFHISFLVNNEFFVRERGVGILKLSGDSLKLIKGSEYMKDFGVFSIIQSSDPQKLLVVTHEDGFWAVDKETFSGKQIKTAEYNIYSESEIYGCVQLQDGKLAINTLSGGIIITDESFKILSVINKDSGLKVNSVLSLLQDYQGNIWAGLENGIAQVFYSSPLSFYGSESGISGNINDIIRYNGDLFIATTNGLFVQNNDFKSSVSPFRRFGGLFKGVNSLILTEGSLLVATMDELYEVRNSQLKMICTLNIDALHYSKNLKQLFISGKKKFYIYEYRGSWLRKTEIPEIDESIVRFEETETDKTSNLWMGTSLQGVVRLQITKDHKYKVDKYNSSDGLLENSWVLPFRIDNKIVFSHKNGLLMFIDEKTIQDQLPDSLKNRPQFYKGYFDAYRIDSTKMQAGQPVYALKDTHDRIYVNLDGELGYFDKANSCSFVNQPFRLADVGKVNTFFYEDNGICWIGGDDGLLKFDERNSKNYNADFKTLITKISGGRRDSVLFYDYLAETAELTGGMHKTIKTFEIDYSLNTITFNLAAPFFEGQEKILYSYNLGNQDTLYSSWSSDTKIILGNLHEGNYIFKVRAMNAYGHIGSGNTFRFRILAPWYHKWWAYILYLLLFALFFITAIRLNSRRLIAQNKKLETIIQERTREINEKNIELEKQKEEILSSINYALRIQKAILPGDELLHACLKDYFILHRPKDIVSGDFYWAIDHNRYTLFCVADCTGHGVPGAFMSMLCTSLLNEVVMREEIIHPEDILNKLRGMIIQSLKQKGISGEQKDGMDIALGVMDRETRMLEFSGANNPLYIIRSSDRQAIPCHNHIDQNGFTLYEIKGDRMPIAIFENMNSFQRQTIELLEDDRLYLFSDGISDQFGGPDGKRYKKNTLRSTLMETISPSMTEQQKLIEGRITLWQSYVNPLTRQPYKQVDDICLMGIKI
jgi:serine phosphatase RsbU (regulator of sigma subunit)/ligand-binding sensor domain-containing protein